MSTPTIQILIVDEDSKRIRAVKQRSRLGKVTLIKSWEALFERASTLPAYDVIIAGFNGDKRSTDQLIDVLNDRKVCEKTAVIGFCDSMPRKANVLVSLGLHDILSLSQPESLISLRLRRNYLQFEALRQTRDDQDLLRVVKAQVRDFIVEIDHDYRIVSANASFLLTMGYDNTFVKGKDICLLMPKEKVGLFDYLCKDARRSPLAGPGVTFELLNCHDEVVPLRMLLWAPKGTVDKRGPIFLFAQSLREVEDSKQETDYLHEQLAHQQKLASMGNLIAEVNHELSSPMTIVKGNSDVISDLLVELPLNVDLISELNVSNLQAIERMGRLVEHLKRRSRQVNFNPSRVDINSLVKGAFYFLEVSILKRDIELEIELSPVSLWVEVDQGQIEQVIINIINNACRAIEKKRQEESADEGLVVVSTFMNKGGLVEIAIWNNGVPIPDAIKPKLFEAYFTTDGQNDGTGIGLTISNRIITRHNGALECESHAATGTIFRILLPPYDNDNMHETQKGTVVLVAMNSADRLHLTERLRKNNYHVITIESVGDALTHLINEPVCGVVVDVDELTAGGQSFVRMVHATYPDIIIHAMAKSVVVDQFAHLIKKAGAIHVFEKPVDEAVMTRIDESFKQ